MLTFFLILSPTALVLKLTIDAALSLFGRGNDAADLAAADDYLARSRARSARLGR